MDTCTEGSGSVSIFSILKTLHCNIILKTLRSNIILKTLRSNIILKTLNYIMAHFLRILYRIMHRILFSLPIDFLSNLFSTIKTLYYYIVYSILFQYLIYEIRLVYINTTLFNCAFYIIHHLTILLANSNLLTA